MHVLLPVPRHSVFGPGHPLVNRMVLRRRELWPLVGFLGVVAVEPVLTWLEAADERMPGGRGVRGRVLHGRGVAAADVPALRAPAQVHPPAASGIALDAPGTARRHRRVNARYLAHSALLSIILHGNRQPHAEPRVTRRRH